MEDHTMDVAKDRESIKNLQNQVVLNRDEFSRLLVGYKSYLTGSIRNLKSRDGKPFNIRNSDDIEAIIGGVWIEAINRFSRGQYPWHEHPVCLARYARDHAIDFFRKKHGEITDSLLVETSTEMMYQAVNQSPLTLGIISNLDIIVDEVLERLDPINKKIFILRILKEWSLKACSSALEMPVSTVSYRCRKIDALIDDILKGKRETSHGI